MILADRDCIRPTFFHSAATCLHVPARLRRGSTKHEGRKPRASERHVVGCCEELARGSRESSMPLFDEAELLHPMLNIGTIQLLTLTLDHTGCIFDLTF